MAAMTKSADLPADKQVQLQSLLGRLSHANAANLITALERDRLAAGSKLPHDLLIDFLRGSAASGAGVVRRAPNPQRLFCQPFEDLLSTDADAPKREGRISRHSLNPIWRWLGDELLSLEIAKAKETLPRAVLAGDDEAQRATLQELHRKAGEAMNRALRDAEREKDGLNRLAERLGGMRVIEDAREIAKILEIGPEIMEVQARLPRPIEHMTSEDLYDYKQYYVALKSHAPDHAKYLLLVTLGRMRRPWDMMGVTDYLAHSGDSRISNDEPALRVVGESLIHDAEEFAAYFDANMNAEMDSHAVREGLREFTQLYQGVAKEQGALKRGEWARRLSAARGKIADALERRLELALKAIRGALPLREAGGRAGLLCQRPDVSRDPVSGLTFEAQKAAALMLDVRDYAHQVGFAQAADDLIARALDETDQFCRDMVVEIRACRFADRPRAMAVMTSASKVLAALGQNDEAGVWRKRAELAAKAA